MTITFGERIYREAMGIGTSNKPKGDGYRVLTEEHPFLREVSCFMKGRPHWFGTASDLLLALDDRTTPPNTVTKLLKKFRENLYQSDSIEVVLRRTNRRRIIEMYKGR